MRENCWARVKMNFYTTPSLSPMIIILSTETRRSTMIPLVLMTNSNVSAKKLVKPEFIRN